MHSQSCVYPGLFNVTVADPLQKSVTIEGLRQNQEYTCSVSALTKVGPGLPASVIIRTKIDCELYNVPRKHKDTTILLKCILSKLVKLQ